MLSDEDVSEKCRSIVENFESWFDSDTIKWLEETQWELVSTRHKDMVIEVMTKFQYPYGSEFSQVFALGYMDPAYAFPRIARFKNGRHTLARSRVAESVPMEGQYKEPALRILVELLFDPDTSVQTSVACTISRRLEDTDSLPLLLFYYFENIHEKPLKRLPNNECSCDWVRKMAESKYRGVLVPWLEEIRDKTGRDPTRTWMNYDPEGKWSFWWNGARAELTKAMVEGKKIAQKMKRKYL